MKKEGIILFYNTHEAIRADKIIEGKNRNVSLIPTHPDISLGCGFMLKCPWEELEDVLIILNKEQIKYKSVYYSYIENIKRKFTLLYENEKGNSEDE